MWSELLYFFFFLGLLLGRLTVRVDDGSSAPTDTLARAGATGVTALVFALASRSRRMSVKREASMAPSLDDAPPFKLPMPNNPSTKL
jgi:hypothetical protein